MNKKSYNLIIVESPAKSKTIEKYLGGDYKVLASYGHVRDLPSGKMGVDTENHYTPTYVIPTKARKNVTALKKAITDAKTIYLATDPDREGEAIAWHVVEATGLKTGENLKRIAFHAITKADVNDALKHPRQIDVDLVNAQQARRIIDRLVGFSLSPVLWRKVYRGLSAGRVQSVAVRLVVEREREIEAFKPVEYWSIDAELAKDKTEFKAGLVNYDNKKIDKLTITSAKEAETITQNLENAKYTVREINAKEEKRQPYGPYITSSLQQDAYNRLTWSAKKTMMVAQGLYEAGHITYMRTDSMNISPLAIDAARQYIRKTYGDKYLSTSVRVFKTKAKLAQEAHEAIRPADPTKAVDVLTNLDADQKKLYELIWGRFMATQMAEARFLSTAVTIDATGQKAPAIFQANGIQMQFDGWRKVYGRSTDDKILPELNTGESLDFITLNKDQHFTEPPARYSEATLIKALEERGIGRPSTYAPTLATIIDRGYVRRDSGRLHPEKVGLTVNDLLVKHFPDIVNYDFTANVEKELDDIAEGAIEWTKVVDEIYQPLSKQIETEEEKIEKVDMVETTDQVCPECGKSIVIRRGRFGQFYACSGFPDCKYTKPFLTPKDEELQAKADAVAKSKKCPKCKADLVVRKGRFGWFVGCSKYPECKFIENIKADKAVVK